MTDIAFHRLPYVSRKLHAALLTVPVADPPAVDRGQPPVAVWSVLAGEESATQLWLLTPAIMAVILRSASQMDGRILAGKISADMAGEVLARYQRIMRHAEDAAAAGWWWYQRADDAGTAGGAVTAYPEPPSAEGALDFDDVCGLLRAAEIAEAHNAAVRERGMRGARRSSADRDRNRDPGLFA